MTLDGHILLTIPPEWSAPVRSGRAWRVDVGAAADGSEYRIGARQSGAWSMRYTLRRITVEEAQALIHTLAAIQRTGKTAIPAWGHAARIVGAVGKTLHLDEDAWPWLRAGDYLWIAGPDTDSGEVMTVQSIQGATVTCTSAPSEPAGKLCWPILFGRGKLERASWHTTGVLDAEISWEEHPRRDPIVIQDACTYTFTATSGGSDTFECYAAGADQSLTGGGGWAAPWVFVHRYYAGADDFEAAPEGPVGNGLASGQGWATAWSFNGFFSAGADDWESYETGQYAAGQLSGGNGWGGAWSWVER